MLAKASQEDPKRYSMSRSRRAMGNGRSIAAGRLQTVTRAASGDTTWIPPTMAAWIGWHHLSNATCLIRPVFYGITCLMRLIEFAASFATFEENMCQTSSVRQVIPPEWTNKIITSRGGLSDVAFGEPFA